MAIKYEAENQKTGSRGRGRPALDRTQISVRLDNDVIEKLKAGGTGWQARMNTILRGALGLPNEGAVARKPAKK